VILILLTQSHLEVPLKNYILLIFHFIHTTFSPLAIELLAARDALLIVIAYRVNYHEFN